MEMNFIARSNFTNDQDSVVYNRIAMRLLPFLLLLYIISFLDRVNVGFAKLQMSADIGLGDAAYGLGAGIFFLGYCLCEIPSNLLLQRLGAKFWIARIMIVWGIISVGMMFVSSATSFYVMRFLLGVAEAGFYPGIILYLTYWFPARLRSQVCAFFFLGIALSGVIGGPLSGWIMQSLGGSYGLKGWQWLFLVEGTPAILLGMVTYWYLDNGPASADWLSAEEKRVVVSELAAEDKQKLAAGHGHKFSHAMKDVNTWMLAFANFSLLSGIYGVSFWLPQIVKDLGVKGLMDIGLLTAIPFSVAAVGMVLIGKHSDRTGERKWHIVLCAVCGAGGLILSGVFGHNPIISLLGLSLATLGALAGLAVMWSLPSSILSGAAAAAGIALMATVGNLGGYLAPLIVGWVKQSTQQVEYGLYVLAAMMLLGAVVTLLIPKLRKSAPASSSVQRTNTASLGTARPAAAE
jgi:D-galactonate transporter